MKAVERRWLPAAIALIGFAWCLPGILSPRGFWMADETRYADVIRHMVEQGNWLVPQLNGFFYPDKPPLYFWLCAGVSLLTGGITPAACMLVTGLASGIWLAVSFVIARDMFGERKALFGVCVMMSNLLFLSCAQIVRMDAMMAMFVALSLHCFHRWIRGGGYRLVVLAHVFTGLAVMSKGPLGFAFAFLPPVFYLAQARRWSELRRFCYPWHFAIPLGMAGGWLTAAWFTGNQEFVKSIFMDQLLARSVGAGAVHSEPFFFYALVLAPALFPWTPFLPRALRYVFDRRDDRWRLLACWFLPGFVIISAVSGKLYLYLLPLLPPLAILLGCFAEDLIGGRVRAGRAFMVEAGFAAALALGLPAALPCVIGFVPDAPALQLGLLPVLLVPPAVLCLWAAWAGRIRIALAALFIGYGLFSASLFLYIAPQIDTYCTGREAASEIARRAGAGQRVATLGMMRGILNFHAETETAEVNGAGLTEFLSEPSTAVVLKRKRVQENIEAMRAAGAEVQSEHNTVMGRLVVVGRADPVSRIGSTRE